MAKTSDDMVLVPREPTPEMIAAMAVIDATMKINGVPTLGMGGAEDAYAAMLAAAPAAQAAKPAQRLTDEQITDEWCRVLDESLAESAVRAQIKEQP